MRKKGWKGMSCPHLSHENWTREVKKKNSKQLWRIRGYKIMQEWKKGVKDMQKENKWSVRSFGWSPNKKNQSTSTDTQHQLPDMWMKPSWISQLTQFSCYLIANGREIPGKTSRTTLQPTELWGKFIVVQKIDPFSWRLYTPNKGEAKFI